MNWPEIPTGLRSPKKQAITKPELKKYGRKQNKMHFIAEFLLSGAAIILQHLLPSNVTGTVHWPLMIAMPNLNRLISTGYLDVTLGEQASYMDYRHGAILLLIHTQRSLI